MPRDLLLCLLRPRRTDKEGNEGFGWLPYPDGTLRGLAESEVAPDVEEETEPMVMPVRMPGSVGLPTPGSPVAPGEKTMVFPFDSPDDKAPYSIEEVMRPHAGAGADERLEQLLVRLQRDAPVRAYKLGIPPECAYLMIPSSYLGKLAEMMKNRFLDADKIWFALSAALTRGAAQWGTDAPIELRFIGLVHIFLWYMLCEPKQTNEAWVEGVSGGMKDFKKLRSTQCLNVIRGSATLQKNMTDQGWSKEQVKWFLDMLVRIEDLTQVTINADYCKHANITDLIKDLEKTSASMPRPPFPTGNDESGDYYNGSIGQSVPVPMPIPVDIPFPGFPITSSAASMPSWIPEWQKSGETLGQIIGSPAECLYLWNAKYLAYEISKAVYNKLPSGDPRKGKLTRLFGQLIRNQSEYLLRVGHPEPAIEAFSLMIYTLYSIWEGLIKIGIDQKMIYDVGYELEMRCSPGSPMGKTWDKVPDFMKEHSKQSANRALKNLPPELIPPAQRWATYLRNPLLQVFGRGGFIRGTGAIASAIERATEMTSGYSFPDLLKLLNALALWLAASSTQATEQEPEGSDG